jgi:hypothetical protein
MFKAAPATVFCGKIGQRGARKEHRKNISYATIIAFPAKAGHRSAVDTGFAGKAVSENSVVKHY